MQNLTTTLPATSTGQNGSGVAATNQVVFDKWDRPNWQMDERGFITYLAYDQATGGPLQRIDDVNTSIVSGAPAGWTTPSDGGLNLYTDFQVDNLGRTTEILFPSIVNDLAGIATTIRRAKWFVYQDATYQTWSAEGYATGTALGYTYFMIIPVSITITDAEGRVTDQISSPRMTISYGTSGGINDSASRVDSLIDSDSMTLVNYTYLGLGIAAQVTYPQPGIQYTLLGSGSGNNPVTGDIYWGLDLFSRIIDSRWFNTSTNADVDRIKYGYDRGSNRIWRQNPVATAAGAKFDEHYDNDGLQRLKDMRRGTLNGSNTAITSPTFSQCWTLDPTGNWMGFNESTNGTSRTTTETRTANAVNEITNISMGAGVAYDAAGNMTTIPQIGVTPTSPTIAYWETLTVADWASMTVDQWAGLLIVPELTATYDAWNRMIGLTDVASGNTVQQNQYDARNFRTTILSYSSGTFSETRHSYFTSDWRCIEERTGSPPTMDRQFVWGIRYVDDLILRDRSTERLYALQDANWNATGVSSQTGALEERYTYTAYGTPTVLSGTFAPRPASIDSWESLYCAYRLDVNAGIYSIRLRNYNPVIGTWCQRDPLQYNDSASMYAYSISNPLANVDPDGSQIALPVEPWLGPFTLPKVGLPKVGAPAYPQPITPVIPIPPGMVPGAPVPKYVEPTIPALPNVEQGPMAYPECWTNGKLRPSRNCSLAELNKLSTKVDQECKQAKLGSCSGMKNAYWLTSWSDVVCEKALAVIDARLACFNARYIRETKCYLGGNSTHQVGMQDQINAITTCADKMKLNGCINKLTPGPPVRDIA